MTAGKIARAKSVTISMAEKKKLISLSSLRLQDPVVVSPHRVVIGWQMLATPAMKMIAAAPLATMIIIIDHVKKSREPAMRSRVTAILHLMTAAPEA